MRSARGNFRSEGNNFESSQIFQCVRSARYACVCAQTCGDSPRVPAATMPVVEDMLNPSQAREARRHKLKRLVQSPNRFVRSCAGALCAASRLRLCCVDSRLFFFFFFFFFFSFKKAKFGWRGTRLRRRCAHESRWRCGCDTRTAA